MADQSPEGCIKRIENGVGILSLRLRPGAVNLLPQVSSIDLAKMVALDAATLLAHFIDYPEAVPGG